MKHILSFAHRDSFVRLGLIASGFATALVLALGVAYYDVVMLWLVGAVTAAFVLLTQPLVGLYLLMITLPIQDMLPNVGSATGTRILGMVVFGMWGARKILLRESWRAVLKSPLVQITILFLFVIFASALWAGDRMFVFQGLFTQVQLLLFAVLVIDLTNSWERVDWMLKLLVIAGLIAASFTVDQYFSLNVRRAGDGVAGGVNFTASFLVTLMPLAFYMIRGQEKRRWVMLALAYAVVGMIAIAVTFSRTSYLLSILIVGIYCWEMARNNSGRRWLIMLAGLTLIVATLIPWQAVVGRSQSIVPAMEAWAQTLAGEAETSEVRGYHWRVGIEMFKDAPLLGVGYNNYGIEFLRYQFDVPGATDRYDSPRSPHSSFVGIVANLGLTGVVLWLLILGIGALNLFRAWVTFRRLQMVKPLLITKAITYMFLLQLFYSWALNTHQNKNFWLILALTVVVRNLASAQDQEPVPAKEPNPLVNPRSSGQRHLIGRSDT